MCGEPTSLCTADTVRRTLCHHAPHPGTRITPARLRAQINKLLENTDIKIGEFQRIIGVNANSWGKFMHVSLIQRRLR